MNNNLDQELITGWCKEFKSVVLNAYIDSYSQACICFENCNPENRDFFRQSLLYWKEKIKSTISD